MRATLVAVTMLGMTGLGITGPGIMGGDTAQAGEQPFLGISGEYRESQERELGYRLPGIVAPDTRFDIDPGTTRELDIDRGYSANPADPFYRPTILSGQRARSVQGTGLNVLNEILGID